MKQLLVVLFMLVSIAGMNQTPPQVNRSTNTTIPVDPNLFTKNRFKVPVYPDTASAAITPDSLGLMIYTKTPKSLWYRDSVVGGGHKWSAPTISSTVNWGDILGDIYNQTDLINYIDSVFNSAASDSDHLVGIWPIILSRSNDTIYFSLDPDFLAVTLTDGIKSGCIVSWSGTGLIFDISPCTYVKNTVLYNLPATQITLSPADPSNPRYDVPAVDTDPGYSVVEGDAEANPVIPQVDPATQLPLTSILVPAGDTIPAVTGEVIYDLNTEWTPTTTGTVSFSNLVNPFHLTVSADMSSQLVTRTVTFTRPSGTLDRTDFTLFKLYLDLKATIAAASNVQVRFYNGAVAVTPAVTLTAAHGFTKTDVGYQNITVPLSSVAFAGNIFNRVVITFTAVQGGAYIDWVQLQGNIDPGGPPTGVTNLTLGHLPPLFTTTVTNPTTTPNVAFSLTNAASWNVFGRMATGTGAPSYGQLKAEHLNTTYSNGNMLITDASGNLSWTTAGGGGSVTSFSSGNLSPLFTTSVATATSTPAQTFALSNATAWQTFARHAGTTGAPSYGQLVAEHMNTTYTNGYVLSTNGAGALIWEPTAIIDGTGGVLGDVVTYDGSGYFLTSVFKEYSFTATYGQSTYTDALLSGRHIRVWREGILQTTTQASLSGSTITFSPALAANERVYIETNLKAVW